MWMISQCHYLQNNQLVIVQGSEQGFHAKIEFWMAFIVLRSVIEGEPILFDGCSSMSLGSSKQNM